MDLVDVVEGLAFLEKNKSCWEMVCVPWPVCVCAKKHQNFKRLRGFSFCDTEYGEIFCNG